MNVERVENKRKVKKEITDEKTLQLINGNDDKKIKEIEKVFTYSRLKVYLSYTINLENGNIYSISKGTIKIYENDYFNKLYEIHSGNETGSVIQLDNKDIIVLEHEEEKNTVSIYRLNNRKCFLFQSIKENRTRYKMLFIYSGIHFYSKKYKVEMIKGISGNRFVIASNYGFKIYSLNKNNNYTLILFETHLGGIKYIYEIDCNDFLFWTKNHAPQYMDEKAYNVLLIEKIKLIRIAKAQTEEKVIIIKVGFKNGVNCNEIKKIESLKFSYNSKELYKYTYYLYGNQDNIISDYVILKKKYLIIIVNTDIFIFDLIK